MLGEGKEKESNAVEFIQANCRGINENRSEKTHGLSVIKGEGVGVGDKFLLEQEIRQRCGILSVWITNDEI